MTTEELAKFEELCNKLNELHEIDGYNVALFYCYKITNGKKIKEFQLYSEDDYAIKDNFICCSTLEEIEIIIDNLLEDDNDDEDEDNLMECDNNENSIDEDDDDEDDDDDDDSLEKDEYEEDKEDLNLIK